MPPEIAVLIPTFRRPPGLVAALRSLQEQDIGESFLIVIADNDYPALTGLRVAEQWGRENDLIDRMLLVGAPEPGASQCRNAGISYVLERSPSITSIAMIDDDETADSSWLRKLLDVRQRFAADLVGGPVIFSLPPETPSAIRHANPFRTLSRPTGPLDYLNGTGNLLITTELLRKFSTPFDPHFGLSGGEDADFFERCRRMGSRSVWASEAIVHETVPPSRLSKEWVCKRMYGNGHISARVALKYQPHVVAVVEQLYLIARGFASSAVRYAVLHDPASRFDAALRLQMARGRLGGLRGKAIEL
jgi:glycosyltransferase involved in cell wall biosynthesis